jgi:hypothetical protein
MSSGRLLLCFAALAVALAQARASPLDAETCAKLTSEHAQLEAAGVESNMEKGPDWAKTSLSREQIQQIRRYIELEEQLLFRCRDKSLVKLAPEPDPGSNSEANENDKATPKAVPPPAKNSKAPAAATKKKTDPAKKAAVEPASKAAVGKAKQDPAGAKVKPPAKAAKKPGDATVKRPAKAKADDANKAPPPGPATPK